MTLPKEIKAIDVFEDEMSEITLRHIREIDYLEDWIISAMKLYAKAKLEEAAERARIEFCIYGNTIVEEDQDINIEGVPYSVNKDSIINTPLD